MEKKYRKARTTIYDCFAELRKEIFWTKKPIKGKKDEEYEEIIKTKEFKLIRKIYVH